jgi:hypothetical protein
MGGSSDCDAGNREGKASWKRGHGKKEPDPTCDRMLADGKKQKSWELTEKAGGYFRT